MGRIIYVDVEGLDFLLPEHVIGRFIRHQHASSPVSVWIWRHVLYSYVRPRLGWQIPFETAGWCTLCFVVSHTSETDIIMFLRVTVSPPSYFLQRVQRMARKSTAQKKTTRICEVFCVSVMWRGRLLGYPVGMLVVVEGGHLEHRVQACVLNFHPVD